MAKKFLVWGFAFLVVIGLLGAIFGEEDTTTEKEPAATSVEAEVDEEVQADTESEEKPKKEAKAKEEETKNHVASGENGVFKDDVLMGVGDKENLNELLRYASKDNKEALQEMLLNGKAMFIQKGTEFTMVDAGIITDKIRVDGVEGYVPAEFTRQ